MTELQSTIACPACGHRQTEVMPTNTCQFFYDCKSCGVVLRPHRGDCCVFCSFGSVPCPPVQAARRTGAESGTCCAT
ncbi:GDCCVxC domain-containing (seleno)protein [Rhodoligotrophos defluvii]|uniref:GDCCVxC domain-containing (seleno)protein n=1 Tax=Rhodoligotrophos defluvii TaxID=2561934 RepID=UPI0010C97DB0|nr:GDCCVxC domain-containing (seleno)protein [Rhodoligotrophos defluvii]